MDKIAQPASNGSSVDQPRTNIEFRIAGVICILIGLLYFALVYYAVGLLEGQRFDAENFFKSYSRSQTMMNHLWLIMAVNSLGTLFVVPFIHQVASRQSISGDTLKTMAMIGLAISATSFFTLIARAPGIAKIYFESSEATQKAIEAIHLPALDPFNIIILGMPGLWYIFINISALSYKRLHRIHALTGLLLGVGSWIAVFAQVIHSEILDQIASGAGAILAPVWFIWMGLFLIKRR